MFKRLVLAFLLSILSIVISATVFADSIQLPQTGQTTCSDANGNVIPCTGTGEDGALQEGVAWPSPRFTDNGDQTQTDNLTGLIWPKDGSTPTVGSCTGGYMKWQGALDYVTCLNANNYLGHNDWRLPNINELKSLVNYGQSSPAAWLDGQGFNVRVAGQGNSSPPPPVPSSNYWSSTTNADYTSGALYIEMLYGWVDDYSKSDPLNQNNYYVWPVRGGQSASVGTSEILRTGQQASYYAGDDGALQEGAVWPSPRFTDNGNQTVTDNLTNLMWTRDAAAPGPSVCDAGPINPSMTWPEALY